MSRCVCTVGPWSDRGVCDACGGVSLEVPNITGTPRQLSFITDTEIVDRLTSIAGRARAFADDCEQLAREIT